MIIKSNKRKNRFVRGIAAVETALILPAFLVVSLALVEGGNMFFSWLNVQKAAQVGTRFAVTGQGDEEGDRVARILSEVENILDKGPRGTVEVEIRGWSSVDGSQPGALGSAGSPCGMVEVKVIKEYIPITPVFGPLFVEGVTLSSADRKVNEPWRRCN